MNALALRRLRGSQLVRNGGCVNLRVHFSQESNSVESDVFVPSKRFWSKEVVIDSACKEKSTALDALKSAFENDPAGTMKELAQVEHGLVIFPDFGVMVPTNSGMLQLQHATPLAGDTPIVEQSKLKLILCGFAPRAQSTIESAKTERPVDELRRTALLAAMKQVGLDVSGDDLMREDFAGTPPARIYRSFVCPRSNATTSVMPLDRHAARVADQINFAVRQLRADRASYLRNTDRAASVQADSCVSVIDATSTGDGPARSPALREKSTTVHPVVLVLDNVRSALNVGSMFRTAETAGAAEVVTCGITAHPPHPKLSKTALQALDAVPTRHFDDAVQAVRTLRSEGYTIAVLETTYLSQKYTSVSYPKKVALVLGNEVIGVDTRIVDMADTVLEIPTFGVKNSLNVASAASIVMFEVLRQWNTGGAV